MSKAERTKIVHDLMRGALLAARRDVPEVMVGKQYFIIDDQRDSLDWVKTQLQLVGGDDLEISTARTAAVAQEICTEHDGQFDVVLVNYKRGRGEPNGIEMLAALRRAGLSGEAVTLLYADKLPRGVRSKALAAGFLDTAQTDGIAVQLMMVLARHLLETGSDDGDDGE